LIDGLLHRTFERIFGNLLVLFFFFQTCVFGKSLFLELDAIVYFSIREFSGGECVDDDGSVAVVFSFQTLVLGFVKQ